MIRKKDGFQGERAVVLPPMVVELQERDPITRSLYLTDIGYYPKAEHHHRRRLQPIDQYVLIHCVDGSGYYVLDGRRREVRRGQYFILPPGKPHEYGTDPRDAWTIYWLHFRGEQAAIYAEGADEPRTIGVALHSRIGERILIFDELLTTLQAHQGLEDLRYASSLLHHFLATMRYLGQYRRALRSDEPRDACDVVEAAIHFMRENVERRVTLRDVAAYVGYSPSHFTTLFRRRIGQSPLAYFCRLKVERACHLLLHSDLKVNQICYKVGIDDPFYFSRLFSKAKGVAPSEFRRINEEHNHK
ncbi:MAG: AraC family transcriptional regulator [Bacteroidales bacterium]|jgi:AraC-like DNA-binding protein|nr:AraC family transcriptional regulator [Bacteroidales bacterium]